MFRCIRCCARGESVAAHQVRQVWPETSRCGSPGDRMAIHACLRLENTPSRRHALIGYCLLLLILHPCRKIFRSIDVDAEQHFCMLYAAELRALSHVDSRMLRGYPQLVYLIREQILLPRQLWHPETMDHVCREQREIRRRRCLGIAQRHMQLIDRVDAELRIVELPPELVADHSDIQCRFRLRSILDREDHACSRKKEHDDNQHRDNGPGQLHLNRSIYLRWLACVIVSPLPKAKDRIGK